MEDPDFALHPANITNQKVLRYALQFVPHTPLQYGYRALEWRGKYAVTAPGNETWKILLRAIRLETSGFSFCVLTQEKNVGLDPRALKEPTVRSGAEVSMRVLSGIQKVYEEHTKRRIK